MNVPDIGGLLGKISEKRDEMPKTPVQSVQPLQEFIDQNTDTDKALKDQKEEQSKAVKDTDTDKALKAQKKEQSKAVKDTDADKALKAQKKEQSKAVKDTDADKALKAQKKEQSKAVKDTDADKALKAQKKEQSKAVKDTDADKALKAQKKERSKAVKKYVKISPRIPKFLKKQVEIALINEQFKDSEGNLIKTLDEIVSLALERLLFEK